MGFLNGRVTYLRYRVLGENPLPFGEEMIERANAHLIGRHMGTEATDGVSVGWAGGNHILDTEIDLEKNVINDSIHLAIRVDTNKIPASLLKAYTRIETDARAKNNPSGHPTKSQRTEAKEAAQLRAEAEAADGRFLKKAFYPLLWDGQSNVLYAGVTSATVLERLQTLFRETFDLNLEPITSGSLAHSQAEERGLGRMVEDFGPVVFSPEGSSGSTVAWTDDDASSRDFWGNEFLLWLWHKLQADGDTITLPDDSEVTLMLAKTLTLDCPRGENGRDQLTTEGPTKLPEALRALQAGKLPRKAGMIIVRHGKQYDLTLSAENLSVNGAGLPKIEGRDPTEIAWARVDALRHLVETLDLLYDAYGRRRIGPDWSRDLTRIRSWLKVA
jgi:hypothetical protein